MKMKILAVVANFFKLGPKFRGLAQRLLNTCQFTGWQVVSQVVAEHEVIDLGGRDGGTLIVSMAMREFVILW
jgi:hypothetical protein